MKTTNSFELTRLVGLTHTEAIHIIEAAEKKHLEAGGAPFARGTINAPRSGKPTPVYLLTDDEVRYIATVSHSKFWARLCLLQPRWLPAGIDREELQRRARTACQKADERRKYHRLARRKALDDRLAAKREAQRERELRAKAIIDEARRERQRLREAERARREAERNSPEAIRRREEARRRRIEALQRVNNERRRELHQARLQLDAAREEAELEAAGLYTFPMAQERLHLPPGECLSDFLERRRVITYSKGRSQLLPPYDGHGYTTTATVRIGRNRDTPASVTVWTKQGLQFLRRVIAKAQADPHDGQWWHTPPVY